VSDKYNYFEIALRALVVIAMGAYAWQSFRKARQGGKLPLSAYLALLMAMLVYFVGLAFLIVGAFPVDDLRHSLLIGGAALLWGAGGLYGLVRLEIWLRRKAPAAPTDVAEKDRQTP
jgi:hypothetical protein